MPPEKPYWPKTKAEFDKLVEQSRDQFLPTLRKCHVHQLVGMNEALAIAFEEIKAQADQEDVRRGHRPPGTRLGNA